jgi:hypothetical protein
MALVIFMFQFQKQWQSKAQGRLNLLYSFLWLWPSTQIKLHKNSWTIGFASEMQIPMGPEDTYALLLVNLFLWLSIGTLCDKLVSISIP